MDREVIDYRQLLAGAAQGLSGPSRPLACCLVVDRLEMEFPDWHRAGFQLGLARALAQAGHQVTLVQAGGSPQIVRQNEPVFSEWREHFALAGVKLVQLPWVDAMVGQPSDPLSVSLRFYNWLKSQACDRLYLGEHQAIGYYALTAKRQGLGFASTAFVVMTHEAMVWRREGNKQPYRSAQDIQVAFMEKRCVELADCIVAPTRFGVQWMADQGWKLPATVWVIPPLLPSEADLRLLTGSGWPAPDGLEPTVRSNEGDPISELVYVGRLDLHSGLGLFLGSLERLKSTVPRPQLPRLSFIGSFSRILGQHSGSEVLLRLRDWPASLSFYHRLNYDQATDYLRGAGRLAVIPSLRDHFSWPVSECLRHGLAFIATKTGGIPEMVDPGESQEVLASLEPAGLANRLRAALDQGVRPAQPAADQRTIEQAWNRFNESIGGSLLTGPDRSPWRRLRSAAPAPASEGIQEPDAWRVREPARTSRPLVSVVIAHFNRPRLLAQAIRSLEQQTYDQFEVIVVDDGSTSEDARQMLAELEPRLNARSWRLLRQPNRYLGAARNAGAALAQGEYLLFMDDDNFALPWELATFVQAAAVSQAEVLTCLSLYFWDDQEEPKVDTAQIHYLPVGACVAAGLLLNCFGDANALIRREVFQSLGGFDERRHFAAQDHHLFLRAALAGRRLEVIPEPLYCYRVSHESMFAHAHPFDSMAPLYESAAQWPARHFGEAFDLFTEFYAMKWHRHALFESCAQRVPGGFWSILRARDENSPRALEALARLAEALARPTEAARMGSLARSMHPPARRSTRLAGFMRQVTVKYLSAKWRRSFRRKLARLYGWFPR